MTLAWVAAAWIGGVVASALLGAAAWPLMIVLAALIAAVAIARDDRRLAAAATVLPMIFAAGALRFALDDEHVSDDDVSRYNGGVAMRVRGELRADPSIADTSQSFAVSIREEQNAGVWRNASGGIQVRTGYLPRYRAGDIIELEGRLEAPPTDEGFDYSDYLAQRGIHSTIAFPRVRVVGHEESNVLQEGLRSVRRHLAHALAVSLPEPEASLAQGVLLGKRSALPPDLRDDLNATNTSHLVVVSGANVVLVSAFAVGALAWIFGRRRALWLSIAAIVAYMLLVGLSPPVVRGAIMGILLVIAQVSGRRTNGLVSILVAAALMIAIDPDAVRDVSFQLSFAATAGIVFLASPIHAWTIEGLCWLTRREALPRPASALVVMPLATTLAAIIATEPIIALNFGRISLVAIPANMLVIPVFPLVLGASAVAAIGGLLPQGHLLFAAPAHYALAYWIAVAGWLASLPAASVTFNSYTSGWAATTYVGVTVVAFFVLRRFGHAETPRLDPGVSFRPLLPFVAIGAPVALLVATAGFVFRSEPEPRLQVTILDVGQGDAILVETPDGKDILVDGGPGRAVLRALGDELSWHDRSIELMVLTHPQADHMYGLLDVLDRYDVRRIIAGWGKDNSTGSDYWDAAASTEGVPIEHPGVGTVFDLGDGVRMEVLGPGEGMAGDSQLNNTSLVIRIVWQDVSILLTGDIEAKAEQALIASGVDLQSTVLKVPHHGSATSSSADFLAAVQPSIAIVSSGKDNQFGHPNAEVVDRLDDFGDVLTTAERGSVRLETDGKRIRISTDK